MPSLVKFPVEQCVETQVAQYLNSTQSICKTSYRTLVGFKPPEQLILKHGVPDQNYDRLQALTEELYSKRNVSDNSGFYSAVDNKLVVTLSALLDVRHSFFEYLLLKLFTQSNLFQ